MLFDRMRWIGTAAALAAGCVHAPSERVADEWRLVGPFRSLAAVGEVSDLESRSESRSKSPTESRSESRSETAPTGGLFDLQGAPPELNGPGTESPAPAGPAIDAERHPLFAPADEAEDAFWYLDLGFRLGITRLAETKQQLDRRVNLPLAFDAFGVFADPNTPIDRKSDLALTTGYVGIGRRETEWLTWNFYLGTGVGADRERQRWLNAILDVNFAYAFYYTGFTVDLYPWGLSQRGRYKSFVEHLKASRPYVVTGLEVGYVRARGWGQFALAPIPLYADEQEVEDWLVSYLLGAGWEVPIDDRWAFNVSGHYTFHFYRPEEYNGWNITTALRYRF